MDINTKPPARIKVTAIGMDNGTPKDRILAATWLKVGRKYTLKEIFPEDYRTEIIVEEIPDLLFNSVHFENV